MNVCVVGGGPAGMMAAIAAAERANTVTLVEKNDKLGKKLFLTGKGRCNLTNSCPVEELFDNIVTNPKFMYSSIYDFDNSGTVAFFNSLGLDTKVERGQRVFPVSDHSSDVIKTLKKKLDSLRVNIMTGTEAVGFVTDDRGEHNKISQVIIKSDTGEKKINADAVIVATGGRSYPLTGSDGSMLGVLNKMGIKIRDCEPSLVPFVCSDKMITGMQGLALKNVGITVMRGGHELYSGFGEMLFTHFGISGPLILSASSFVKGDDLRQGIRVLLDLKPALSSEELDRRILRDFGDNMNKDFGNSLGGLLPSGIITAVIQKCGISPSRKVNSITRQERNMLCKTLKCFEIDVHSERGFDEAIITRGGVDVKEIDPSTMECRKIKGLYFAGEMIDVDALTGGFNLQIAWSTGHLAGQCR